MTATVNSATGSIERSRYTPYGQFRLNNGIDDHGFLNEQHDPGGLVYLNARYHDPTLGSFLSVGPAITATWQPYTYADSNPSTHSDRTGLCTWDRYTCDDYKAGSPTSKGDGARPLTFVGTKVFVPYQPDWSPTSALDDFMGSLPMPLYLWLSLIGPGDLQPLRRAPRIVSLVDNELDNIRPYDARLDAAASALDEFTRLHPKYGNPVRGPVAAWNGRYLRSFDAEILALEHLARKLDASGESIGSLDVGLNRAPCPSCRLAFSQFQQRYPGIENHSSVDFRNTVLQH